MCLFCFWSSRGSSVELLLVVKFSNFDLFSHSPIRGYLNRSMTFRCPAVVYKFLVDVVWFIQMGIMQNLY